MIEFTGKEYLREITFNSFEQLFIFLSENIKNRKIVLAIDEYQQLVKLDRSFSSIIQKVWDNNLKTGKNTPDIMWIHYFNDAQ